MDRSRGDVYTPPALAKIHAANALAIFLETSGNSRNSPTVVDLACGNGALLQAAQDLGTPPQNCWGYELDPDACRQAQIREPRWKIAPPDDSLFRIELAKVLRPWDIALCNPPWIGKVSATLGADYAKRVADHYGPDYNAASDLCAAFVLQASRFAHQLSFLTTNTAWQGRTFRSGVKRLLLSGHWAALWFHDPAARYTGLTALPSSQVWPGDANVHFIAFHLVRVSCDRYSQFQGGHHYGLR